MFDFFESDGESLFVEADFNLGHIEIERTAVHAVFTEFSGQLPSLVDFFGQLALGGLLQNLQGFAVGQPVAGPDDGARDALGEDAAGLGQGDDGGKGEPVHAGEEGAEAVGEFLREHRDDLVDQIDAVATAAGFSVEGTSGLDVVGDIGDVDADFPFTATEGPYVDGVIEVFGGVRVDGEDKFVAEVETSGVGGGVMGMTLGVEGEVGNFSQGFGGEAGRKLVLADDGEDIDVGIAGPSEALDDSALGIEVGCVPAVEADDDFVTEGGLGAEGGGAGGGDVDALLQAEVVGDDVVEAAGFLKCADEGGAAALKDADDLGVDAVAEPSGGRGDAAGDDEVLVQGGACFAGRDDGVLAAFFIEDEGEALGVEADDASDEVGVSGKDIAVAANPDDGAIAFHCRQRGIKFFTAGGGKFEFAREGISVAWLIIRMTENFNDRGMKRG